MALASLTMTLRVVRTGERVGRVWLDDTGGHFSPAAANVFARLRDKVGNTNAARSLLEKGWSNGYLSLSV